MIRAAVTEKMEVQVPSRAPFSFSRLITFACSKFHDSTGRIGSFVRSIPS
jgi:hypothetical protein